MGVLVHMVAQMELLFKMEAMDYYTTAWDGVGALYKVGLLCFDILLRCF